MDELLTEAEHKLIATLGACASMFGREVVGHGDENVRAHDINEFVAVIHVAQKQVMGQAAARAFPNRYRLLGERLPE